MTDSKERDLQEIGRCAMESIAEMVAAVECDYDRLEELRDAESGTLDADDLTELAELMAAAGECESQDSARERIQEDALSVEVRSGWYTPGGDSTPEEYCILLSTGGPATRIIGELDQHMQPSSARLQAQDWFTPWTEYVNARSRRPAHLRAAILLRRLTV